MVGKLCRAVICAVLSCQIFELVESRIYRTRLVISDKQQRNRLVIHVGHLIAEKRNTFKRTHHKSQSTFAASTERTVVVEAGVRPCIEVKVIRAQGCCCCTAPMRYIIVDGGISFAY